VHVLADSSLNTFLEGVNQFFSSLAALSWGYLLLGLTFHGFNLALRSRAAFNVLRAAYPAERFQWRRIFGAYVAGVGFNAVVPARGGDIIKLFLCRSSIPNSSYPAVGAGLTVDALFDASIAILVLIFSFTQGVFPKPPDFSKLNAFDLSYFASHTRFTLFVLTALGIVVLIAFAMLSARVKAFWARVRQGYTILRDRRRYFREVYAVQFLAWLCRFTGFWFLLDAFHVGGSVRNVLLVFGVNAVSTIVPFTPGGAGVQQALLLKVFANNASSATIAAYAVGQQLAIAIFSFALGFCAIVFIFKFRSFGEVIRAGKAARAAEEEAEAAGVAPTEAPAAPLAPGRRPRERRSP
jgi:uncharacterized membrane protein YbhN (UPF0104 family)